MAMPVVADPSLWQQDRRMDIVLSRTARPELKRVAEVAYDGADMGKELSRVM